MSIEYELRGLVKSLRIGQQSDVDESLLRVERYLSELDSDRLTYAALIEEARENCDAELEIDHEPLLSVTEEAGVWVNAWVYVHVPEYADSE